VAYIYGLSLDGADFRYVGATTSPIGTRLAFHVRAANAGRTAPVSQWMTEVGPKAVTATILEEVGDDARWDAEVRWISRLRAEGYDLLNVAIGGRGRPGALLTEDQRRALGDLRRGKPHGKRHEFRDPQRQVDSGARGAHNRWHVARGKTSERCAYCAAA
jgi:hypothetical protein